MSNIPENENLNVTADNAETETSTVFSDPSAHSRAAETVKPKKRILTVIASLLAVAVLAGGTLAVVKFIPEREEDTDETFSIEDITVLDGSSDDYKSVTVKNSNGTFKLYSVTEKAESSSSDESDTSSEATETVTWYLEGYDKSKIDSSVAASTVSATVSFTASREVTEKSAADCGLDSPRVTAVLEPKSGDKLTLIFGDESPDKSGYYLKLSSSDKIYVVGSDVLTNLEFEALKLADSSAFPAFEVGDGMDSYTDDDGALVSFDSITLSGTKFSEKLVFEMNDDENLQAVAAYKVTSPTERIADKVDSVFAIFKSGLSATGAYSFDTSASALARFGLDKPDISATMKVGKKSMTYRFKLQSDGSYAAYCDGTELIKIVDASSLTFADYKTTDFYSTWVALVSIDDLNGFAFKTADKTYDFSIKKNETEDEDESEDEEKYIINYNGKKLVASDFQNFYQECISLTCTDFTTEKAGAEPEYGFVFKYSDGRQLKVDFTKVSETRYQYSLNGVASGKVNSAAMSKLSKAVQELVAE